MPRSENFLMLIIFAISLLLILQNSIFKINIRTTESPKYLIIGCDMRVGNYQNYLNYDRNSKTMEVNIVINCCGFNTSVEKHEKTYFIYEKQYGDLCRCICNQKIIIFNVENDAKIVFVSYDNKKTILSPNLEFCGISTNSECQTDEDCITTGCSNQICQSKNEEELMTTCEFIECFDARKFKVSCKCIDNKCQWS